MKLIFNGEKIMEEIKKNKHVTFYRLPMSPPENSEVMYIAQEPGKDPQELIFWHDYLYVYVGCGLTFFRDSYPSEKAEHQCNTVRVKWHYDVEYMPEECNEENWKDYL
jgi:hypothetical protein